MPKCSPANLSDLTLLDLDSIAKETGLVVRHSPKFSASAFLQCLLSAVASGKASLNDLAAGMGRRTKVSLSRQAMDKRLDDTSTAFLTHVAYKLIAQPIRSATATLVSGIFNRILIEDSSFCSLPPGNAKTFPAHGNDRGVTAGVKVDLSYDLSTGTIDSFYLHHATEQDKTIGKDFIDTIRPKDLVLRDMGYFVVSEFARIERLGAFWISRLPAHTKVELADGKSLESLLTSTKEHQLDLDVVISKAGHPCRLVAVRADSSITHQRRKERKKGTTNTDHPFYLTGLIRDGWHLILSNVKRGDASAETLFAIYRMRWDIEIQFRGWKQSLKLDKALGRKSSEAHLMALILAAMIHQILGMHLRQYFETMMPKGMLSIEKLLSLLGQFHIGARAFEHIVEFNPDTRHIQKDTRTRLSPVAIGFAALS